MFSMDIFIESFQNSGNKEGILLESKKNLSKIETH